MPTLRLKKLIKQIKNLVNIAFDLGILSRESREQGVGSRGKRLG
ncbi:hypothetical protein [Chroococcidiopsis sp.]